MCLKLMTRDVAASTPEEEGHQQRLLDSWIIRESMDDTVF